MAISEGWLSRPAATTELGDPGQEVEAGPDHADGDSPPAAHGLRSARRARATGLQACGESLARLVRTICFPSKN